MFADILAIIYEAFDVNIFHILCLHDLRVSLIVQVFFVFVGLLVASAEKKLFIKVTFKACPEWVPVLQSGGRCFSKTPITKEGV